MAKIEYEGDPSTHNINNNHSIVIIQDMGKLGVFYRRSELADTGQSTYAHMRMYIGIWIPSVCSMKD